MVRQGHLIALVVAFLIGCAVLLMADASRVQAETSKKEEARCEGTRTITLKYDVTVVTNDVPGCPKGGLLLGTNKDRPGLYGKEGDDTLRGLEGNDDLSGGPGNDIIYGGPGNDITYGGGGDDVIYGGDGNDIVQGDDVGKDVIYGGAGNDYLASIGGDGQRDKLYCGAGRDKYGADKNDYVDSSCEKELEAVACARIDKKLDENRPLSREESRLHARCRAPRGGADAIGVTSSASASPTPVPLGGTGGPAILLPAAALLVGSGILTYAILRRR